MLFSVYQFCLKCPRQEFDYVVNENHLDQTVQWWWRWITDFVMKTLFYQNNKYWKGILPFSVFCKPFNTCNQVHKFHCCYFLTREICVTKKKIVTNVFIHFCDFFSLSHKIDFVTLCFRPFISNRCPAMKTLTWKILIPNNFKCIWQIHFKQGYDGKTTTLTLVKVTGYGQMIKNCQKSVQIVKWAISRMLFYP